MSDRYNIIGLLASGGMGTIHLARMTGGAGFSRLVAIKRLHPEYASDPQLVAMLVDEARLAAQVRHANVVSTLDLVASNGAFGLVLEYIEGAALSTLIHAAKALGEEVPRAVAVTIIRGMLRGLDAAHEARNAEGVPLGVVHRDVSPQNVLVGVDGVPRLIDFGIAKAMNRTAETTRAGEVRGKFSYMAPEQLLERPVTRQTDIYSAGVLLWQLLVGRLPFESDDNRVVMAKVMSESVPPPNISAALDAVVLKATTREPSERYARARDLYDALAIEAAASDEEVGAWVRRVGEEQLAKQHELRLTVPTDPSRSVEEILGAAAPAALAPKPRARRTWVILPIAGALGAAGVIGGLHASPEKTAVASAVATPATPPVPTPSASAAPPPAVLELPSSDAPTPLHRPPHRHKPAPPRPSSTPAPAGDPDTDHR